MTNRVNVSVISVAAPGDGEIALATAMEQELLRRGVDLSGRITIGAYRLQALVLLGQARNGQRSLNAAWTLADPSGKELGTVAQYNEVPAGLIDVGVWEILAQQAAGGIAMLIPGRR